MTSSESSQRPPRRSRATLGIAIGVIVALVIVFFIFAGLYTDWLWFDQLGFLGVLTTQWLAGNAMFFVGFFAMAVPVWVESSWRTARARCTRKLNAQLDRYQQVIEPLRRVAMYGIPILLRHVRRSRDVLALAARARGGSTGRQTGINDPQFHLDVGLLSVQRCRSSGRAAGLRLRRDPAVPGGDASPRATCTDRCASTAASFGFRRPRASSSRSSGRSISLRAGGRASGLTSLPTMAEQQPAIFWSAHQTPT